MCTYTFLLKNRFIKAKCTNCRFYVYVHKNIQKNLNYECVCNFFFIFVHIILKMVTIKDIAKLANVSIGTVDRVVHNRTGVSQKTRETVQQIIDENNFRINVLARSLALKKESNIAVLMPDFNEENLFWKSPSMGISKASSEVENFGIHMHTYSFNQYSQQVFSEKIEEIVSSHLVFDAVIFTPIFRKESNRFMSYLEAKNIPYMFLNVEIEGFNNLSYIGQDAYKSGYLSGKLMQLCTPVNSDYLIPIFESQVDNNELLSKRIKGFEDYFKGHNLKAVMNIFHISGTTHSDVLRSKIDNVLTKNKNIQGVFVPSSRISVVSSLLNYSKHTYLKLIGFDTTEQNVTSLKEGKVTFLISQKSFNQGYQAVKIMTDYLVQNQQPAKQIFSPIEIITKENLEFSQRNRAEYSHNLKL